LITVPVGVAATGRTKPAVTNGIAALEEAGVLAPVGTARRGRAWEADRLLHLIEPPGVQRALISRVGPSRDAADVNLF